VVALPKWIVGVLHLQRIRRIHQPNRRAETVVYRYIGAAGRRERQHFARAGHREVVADRVGLTGEIVRLRNVLLVMQIGGGAAEGGGLAVAAQNGVVGGGKRRRGPLVTEVNWLRESQAKSAVEVGSEVRLLALSTVAAW
jgi:peptidyl-tRNA hydrolase